MTHSSIIRARRALTISAAVAVAAPAMTMLPAQAAEIQGAVSNIQTAGDTRPGGSFELTGSWSVPDHSQPGDTFTVDLPPELYAAQKSFELTNKDGAVVAHGQAGGGQLVITLSDYVATHPLNIAGDFGVTVTLSESAASSTSLKLVIEGTAFYIQSGEAWGTGPRDTVSKYGVQDPAGGTMWYVDIPGQLTDATLWDAPQGHSIDCSSVAGERGQVTTTGQWPAFTAFQPQVVSCQPDLLIANVGDVADGELVRVKYGVDESQPVTLDENGRLVNKYAVKSGNHEAQYGYGNSADYSAWGSGDATGLPPAPKPAPTPVEEPAPAPEAAPAPEKPTPTQPAAPASDKPSPAPAEQPAPQATPAPEQPAPAEQPAPETAPAPQPAAPAAEKPAPEPQAEQKVVRAAAHASVEQHRAEETVAPAPAEKPAPMAAENPAPAAAQAPADVETPAPAETSAPQQAQPAPAESTPAPASAEQPALAHTGIGTSGLLGGAAALVALGAGALGLSRRLNRSES